MKTLLIAATIVTLMMAGVSTQASADALDTARKNGCMACHSVDKKMLGPAWKEVAAKYKGQKPDVLIASIRHGSKGKWGSIPMPAQTKATDAEVAELASYILSLGK